MRRVRVVGVLFAAFALMATAIPVAADSRDIDQGQLSFFPCLAGPQGSVPPTPGPGNDGSFPNICFVNWGAAPGTPWQASAGNWILFRLPLGAPGTLADCLAANYTISVQLDGVPVGFDALCVQTLSGTWIKTVRHLTHPLAPGTHTATLTVTSGGQTAQFVQSVTVVQG